MLSKHHYITVRNEGTFSGDTDYPTEPEDIDALFAHLEQENITKIGIFAHGGLLGEKSGMHAVKNMQAHVFEPTQTHGIGLVWKSGFMDALKQNMKRVHKTKLFQKILVKILQKAGGKLGFGVLGKGVNEMTEEEILAQLKSDQPFVELEANQKSGDALRGEPDYRLLESELTAAFEQQLMQDPEIRELMNDPEENFWMEAPPEEAKQEATAKGFPWLAIAKPLVKVTVQMVKRKFNGSWHGFHATAIEEVMRVLWLTELAQDIWTAMKLKAEWMWDDHKGADLDELHVGTYFMDKLVEYSEGRDLQLHLIAHSAGAVVTAYMLRRIARKDHGLRFKNILFLAPACTTELFHEEIMPRANFTDRFRMFTMRDIFEADDKLVDSVKINLYPSSLLYFVSGVCEENVDAHILGMERYYSRSGRYNIPELIEVADWMEADGENRVTWSVTEDNAPDGMRTLSKDHGFFDNEEQTLKSLEFLLS